MDKIKYWLVAHNADCTETGCPMNNTYIKTIWEGFAAQQSESAEHAILEDFCFQRFGKKTVWVQGVAPTENWRIYYSSEDKHNEARPIMWGGYKTKTMRLELGIGNRGKINIISEEETN